MKYFKAENWVKDGEPRIAKMIIHGILWLVVLFVVISQFPFGTVGAGERGIRTNFNAVTNQVVQPGLYFRIPFVQHVISMNVQIQKETGDLSAASKDLQTVTSKVALNYHIDPSKVVSVYRDVGEEYNARIIDPALQESLKASTAQFTAEELIQKREDARHMVKELITLKLAPHGIIVDEFNVVDFDFSPQFNQAIEAKVTAEQNALAAKNKLEQVKFEAEQRVTQANAEAQAIKIQASAIQQQGGADYVNLQAIAKWDGHLPQVSGGNTPFININK